MSAREHIAMSARAWIALWTVYILWGSTYLGIELAGETIPPIFAAGVRFTTSAVVLMRVAARPARARRRSGSAGCGPARPCSAACS